jgi:DNA primase
MKIIKEAHTAILSRENIQARKWLQGRGLNRKTVIVAKLGFNPLSTWMGSFFLPGPAIVIPWFRAGQVVAVNFRRLEGEPKYQLLSGSSRGHLYPDIFPKPTKPLLLCEGEFDTLLVNQIAGDLVQAYTVGSASDKPTAGALAAISACHSIFLVHDADNAGDLAAARLKKLIARAVRLRPPAKANDISGLGKRFRSWIKSALEKST